MPRLAALSLSHMRRLKDLSAISCCEQLKYMELDCCGTVSTVPISRSLEVLVWMGSNKIASLNGLLSLPALRRFILGVNVLDGDIDCLMSMEYSVIMEDKRHYTRKNVNLPKSHTMYAIPSVPDYRAVSLPVYEPPR